MSGIYIPGMEMPKNCHLCLYSYLGRDYSRMFCGIDDHYIADLQQWDKHYFWGHKDDSCPIIPVPDHGRLIDADKLMAEYERDETSCDEHGREFSFSFKSGNTYCTEWFPVQQKLMDAPTIIPADKDGAEC